MKNRTTIALMAAALILAVPGQPSGQTADDKDACPCGDPADFVPIEDWRKRDVQCTAPSVSGSQIHTLRVSEFEVPLLRASPDTCLWAGERPAVQKFNLTASQADECVRLLISYAQILKESGSPVLDDGGCNLQ